MARDRFLFPAIAVQAVLDCPEGPVSPDPARIEHRAPNPPLARVRWALAERVMDDELGLRFQGAHSGDGLE
jgi:hypothetical protein